MGYESRLYIGEASSLLAEEPQYLDVIAMFDLSKMGYDGAFADLLERHPAPSEPLVYFYGSDGDTPIKSDLYGENLRPLPLDEVVEALKAQVQAEQDVGVTVYRRLWQAFALFDAFLKMQDQYRNLTVVHYGH